MSSLHNCGHEVLILNYQQILLDSTDTTDYRVPDFMLTKKYEHLKNKNVLSLYYTVLHHNIISYNVFYNPQYMMIAAQRNVLQVVIIPHDREHFQTKHATVPTKYM